MTDVQIIRISVVGQKGKTMAELPVTYLLTFSESEVPNEINSEWHELIRCKECRFYQGKYCTAWDDGTVAVACETDADGYCYLAERKE